MDDFSVLFTIDTLRSSVRAKYVLFLLHVVKGLIYFYLFIIVLHAMSHLLTSKTYYNGASGTNLLGDVLIEAW